MGCLYKRKQKLTDGTYRELPTIWIKYYQNGRAIRESTGTTKETKATKAISPSALLDSIRPTRQSTTEPLRNSAGATNTNANR